MRRMRRKPACTHGQKGFRARSRRTALPSILCSLDASTASRSTSACILRRKIRSGSRKQTSRSASSAIRKTWRMSRPSSARRRRGTSRTSGSTSTAACRTPSHRMSNRGDAPLAGFTVIEHAEGVAASYAGRMLAAMGAKVIKVEPPEGGALRRSEPLLTQEPEASALFHYVNTGKQFVTCDVAVPEGRQLLGEPLPRAEFLVDDTPASRRAAWKL